MLQKISKFLLPKNFSGREALWIAVLFHLIFLLLPQAMIIMQGATPPPQPEPIKFNFTQPDQPLPDITEQPELQHATSTEQSEEAPQTNQPVVQGSTNQRTMESMPQQQPVRPQPEQQTAEEQTESRIDPLDRLRQQRNIERQRQVEEAKAAQQSKALKEAIEQDLKNLQPSEVPLTYNNNRPSSAEVDSFVQFDTYDWNYEPYQARMISKLYQFWVPKLRSIGMYYLREPGRSIIRFHINQDGSLRSVELIGPSGKQAYDMAGNHAIVSPFPGFDTAFPPLPLAFPKETLGVTVGFFVNMEAPNK